MKKVILAILTFIPCLVFCCVHNNTTRKCLPCLRENYMKYGGERAAITCDGSVCPLKRTMVKHKHCGRHKGAVITLTSECQECAKMEAEEHWREAEMDKTQEKAWEKLGITMPEYRVTTLAQKNNMLRKLRNMVNSITKQIEKYEDRMFTNTPNTPALSEVQLRRLEKKIEALEIDKEILMRAYAIWEDFNP